MYIIFICVTIVCVMIDDESECDTNTQMRNSISSPYSNSNNNNTNSPTASIFSERSHQEVWHRTIRKLKKSSQNVSMGDLMELHHVHSDIVDNAFRYVYYMIFGHIDDIEFLSPIKKSVSESMLNKSSRDKEGNSSCKNVNVKNILLSESKSLLNYIRLVI